MEVDRSNQKRVFRCRLLAAMDNEQTIDRDIDDHILVLLNKKCSEYFNVSVQQHFKDTHS